MTSNLKDGGVTGKGTEMRAAERENWGRAGETDAVLKGMLDEAEGVGSEGVWGSQPSTGAQRLKPSGEQMHSGYKRCMIEDEKHRARLKPIRTR